VQAVRPILDRERWAHVITHSRWDSHPDHHAVMLAVSDAVARLAGELPRPEIYQVPLWDWDRGPWPPLADARVKRAVLRVGAPLVALRGGHTLVVPIDHVLSVKRRALSTYASQLSATTEGPPPLPAAFVAKFLVDREVLLPATPSPADGPGR
jgi:LmbE family N-acetylglucosaminyl deacetylase